MRSFATVAFLACFAASAAASQCDYVLQWDAAKFQECIAEYRREIDTLKLQVQTAQAEASNNTKALCLMGAQIKEQVPAIDLDWLTKTACPAKRRR